MKTQTSPTLLRAEDGVIISGKHAIGMAQPRYARLFVDAVNSRDDSLLSDSQVLDLLKTAWRQAGSQARLADQIGMSVRYLQHVMTGRDRPQHAKILKWLGLEREVVYRRKQQPAKNGHKKKRRGNGHG